MYTKCPTASSSSRSKENKGILKRKLPETKTTHNTEELNKQITKAKTELGKLIQQFNNNYNEDTYNQEPPSNNILKRKKVQVKKRSEYDLMEKRSLAKTSKEITEIIKNSDSVAKAEQFVIQGELCQMLISACGAIEGLIVEDKP